MMRIKQVQGVLLCAIFDDLDSLQHAKHAPVHIKLKDGYLQDYQQCADYLLSYRGSTATYNAYRRELERFLQWLWFLTDIGLQDVKRSHMEDYIAFCQSPPAGWVADKHCPRFLQQNDLRVPNPAWRPFVCQPNQSAYQLSEKSLQALFSILSSFFQFLLQLQYVQQNPVAQIRQKSKYITRHQHQAPVRRLSELQWSYVIETVRMMAEKDPVRHERTLLILSLLYGLYLRISELSASARWTPRMNDFKQDADGNWWFYTLGKGNKMRDISVSQEVLEAFKRYRKSMGLTALPSLSDDGYLVPKLKGKGPLTSTRQIRTLVQYCFDETMSRLKCDGFVEEAGQMMAATVHWLRHTGISDDVKHRPREHVRDDAGHSSGAITDRYIDIERRERHASAKHKKICNDDN
jgi:site-specific recombinase XerD